MLAGNPTPGLQTTAVGRRAAALVSLGVLAGRAAGTVANKTAALRAFAAFVVRTGARPVGRPTEDPFLVAAFLADRVADGSRSVTALRSTCSQLRTAAREARLPWLDVAGEALVESVVATLGALRQEPVRRAPPIRLREVAHVVAACRRSELWRARVTVMVVMGHQGMFRVGSMMQLRWVHVQWEAYGVLFHVTQDKALRGRTAVPLGFRHDRLSVPALLRDWFHRLGRGAGRQLRATDYVFPHLERSGPVEWAVPTMPARYPRLLAQLRAVLPPPPPGRAWSWHGLRAGGMTDYLGAGVPLLLARRLGRWKDDSVTSLQYARPVHAELAQLSGQLRAAPRAAAWRPELSGESAGDVAGWLGGGTAGQ